MKYLKSINESILPRELRYKNILYHATSFENLINILLTNTLHSSDSVDFGIATSRNRNYLYNTDGWFRDNTCIMGTADCQLILDRDLIKTKYEINPYDFEEYKKDGSNFPYKPELIQSEDKIVTSEIKNIKRYIIGIHINNKSAKYIKKLKTLIHDDWLVFDKNWNLIKL